MGRQPRLVLLLVITVGLLHLSHSSVSQPTAAAKLERDSLINDLSSEEDLGSTGSIKISTSKVKELSVDTTTSSVENAETSTTKQPVSDETLKDMLEAATHMYALMKDPRLHKMLGERQKQNSSTTSKTSDELYEYDDDDYDYNYDDEEDDEKKTKSSTTSLPKLRPIEESTSSKPKSKATKEAANDAKKNNIDSDSNYGDYDDDDDDDDDDDSDDDDDVDKMTDEEEVVFSEDVPCPRYCTCGRNINSYLVATCSRLDTGTQKFGSDITDLVVTNVGPKYPILLGPKFFKQLGLKSVSSIKIANCTIQYMSLEAFHGLDELYAVNMTDVGLTLINPDTFVQNKKLRMLTISGNDLNVMSSLPYLLKSSSIEELDISRNNLMELHVDAFTKLTNIVYINLSQNNLQKVPEKVFSSVESIEELDLSYNALRDLPTNIFNGTTLSILHLKYNTFTGDLHFGIKDLQQVDLSFNSITKVHHSMFDKMPGLTNLNLRGNGITKIQTESFLMLTSLRHIDLSMNALDQVSSMLFFKNAELDVIRLNDNPRLSQLPTDGFISYNGYFTVYYFDISNCAVGALGHRTFATMPHLTTLKMGWNNINNLPGDVFSRLTKLIDLDLSNNLIAKLDELLFMENNELTKLNLAGNAITNLSMRLFMPLHQLRALDVSDCELTSLFIDREFGIGYKLFDTLRSFNASSNLISRISSSDIKNFKNLRSLDITNNPLKCDDDFQKFISYVSLHTQTMPKKMSVLGNLEENANLIEIETQAGWAHLAQEVCKHNATMSEEEDKMEKRIQEAEKKLNEDEKNFISVINKSELDKSSMQKIMKGSSDNADESKTKETKSEESAEEDLNNGGEEKDPNLEINYDEESNEYDDYSESDETLTDKKIEKKKTESTTKKFTESELKAKVKDHGLKVEEVILSKETNDQFLQDKLDPDSDQLDSEEEEIIIERGSATNFKLFYYSNYMLPIILVITSIVIIVLGLIRILIVVLRKRGERYRMAILASKNSFVYQKLSEDIAKPVVSKEPKQPKVHKYAPINQV